MLLAEPKYEFPNQNLSASVLTDRILNAKCDFHRLKKAESDGGSKTWQAFRVAWKIIRFARVSCALVRPGAAPPLPFRDLARAFAEGLVLPAGA